jgi:hypothetical protein
MKIRLFVLGTLTRASLGAYTSISEIVISRSGVAMENNWLSHSSNLATSRLVRSGDSQFYNARNSMLTKLNSTNSDVLFVVPALAISKNFRQSQIGLLS